MNLTVDQMDVLNFRLTEISLELLGNQFFDIFGRKCNTLGSLYRSKSGPATDKYAANSDLVAALNVADVFNSNADEPPDGSHGGGHVRNDNCKNENNSDESSDDELMESDELGYKDNEDWDATTEHRIAQILNDVDQEYTRLLIGSDSAKMKYFITNKHLMKTEYTNEYKICDEFHKEEYKEFIGQSDAFIKLIKHIKGDVRNEFKIQEIAATILKVKERLDEIALSRP